MRPGKNLFFCVIILTCIGAYSAICFHAVQEIHYLKSFFPRQFGVQDAAFAAVVELIKVLIAGIPFVIVIVVCLGVLRR